MKMRKLITFSLILVAIIFVGMFTNNVKAVETGPGYLTIIKERTVDFETADVTYKHQLYRDNHGETENIWNIVTCSEQGMITDSIPDLYCLRAGLGFAQQNQEETPVEPGVPKSPFQSVNYTRSFDMATEREEIQSQLNDSVTTIFQEANKTSYYRVLWILDHMLLEDATKDELIQYLKDYAKYPESDFHEENALGGEFLTRADIEAIQQLAIWHFTNSDDAKHNAKTLSTMYINIANSGISDNSDKYQSYSELFNLVKQYGGKRQTAADNLYKSLIEGAEAAVTGEEATYEPVRRLTVYLAGGDAKLQQPVVRIEETNKEVDLALRKFISAKNGTPVDTRIPDPDTTNLNKTIQVGTQEEYQKTAKYNHTKEHFAVQVNDIITYTLRIYNEGELPAYATQVTDYLPSYLEYVAYGEDTQGAFWQLDTQTARIARTTENCTIVSGGGNLQADQVKGKKLSEVLIPAAVAKEDGSGYELSYIDIQISCKVMPTTPYDTDVTNLAQITEMKYANKTNVEQDRDSKPNGNFTLPSDDLLPSYQGKEKDGDYYIGQEDDDDFEKVYIPSPAIDLALRKFITQVGETKYNREPVVESAGLATGDDTAKYYHSKEPVSAKIGDIVTYTIRIYNEGEIDAKVTEITDYLATYLEYVPYGEDSEGKWWTFTEGDEYNTVTSTADCIVKGAGGKLTTANEKGKKLGDVVIPAYDSGTDTLSYVDVEIHCKVLPVTTETKVTNIAEITKEADKDGKPVEKENDSTPNNEKEKEQFPDQKEENPNYGEDIPKEENKEKDKYYVPGREDDDDFEKLKVVPRFDLSLRKFITRVGTTQVNNRYPNVTYEEGKLKYEHTKEPVGVATGDVVIYTIRVYNEGEADGYAEEITDDVPEGLEFLPDNETNQEYRWVMLDENEEVTTDVSKAKYLITDYLSEEQGNIAKRDNMIKAFDPSSEISDKNPDYRDVQIAFKVTYTAETKDEMSRTIVNTAQISKDSGDDEDSTPKRDEVYNQDKENEDDIDYDQVKVKYFDLSLLKWVAQTKVTLNGKTTTKNTGHTAETSKDEAPVKIEVKTSDIKKIKIQYIYTIRVTNEGELEGYAKEITDYVPEGLKFVKADNPDWYEISDGVIGTKALENKLLKPGESAEVQVVLTWINGKENFGEKINLAEISQDYNENDSPDVDSTPNNQKAEEDDIDDAPVILAVKTGVTQVYLGLTMIILITFAGGISLIKKYVL